MEWININDREPEDVARCLVTDGEVVDIMVYYGPYKGVQEWTSFTCQTLDVTHWMPLPKPPEL